MIAQSGRLLTASDQPASLHRLATFPLHQSTTSDCAIRRPFASNTKQRKLSCKELMKVRAVAGAEAPTPEKVGRQTCLPCSGSTGQRWHPANFDQVCARDLQITNQTRWARPQSRWLPFRYREALWTTSIRRSSEPSELSFSEPQLSKSQLGKIDELLSRGDTGDTTCTPDMPASHVRASKHTHSGVLLTCKQLELHEVSNCS